MQRQHSDANGPVAPAFHIRPARGRADLATVHGLFLCYAESLPIDLSYQHFAAELVGLPGDYGPPRGEILLAVDGDGNALGCVGLRPRHESASGRETPAGNCEMKRLYVRPEARSMGVGMALVHAVITTARTRGYRQLFLDTLPTMHAAAAMYRRLGFSPCAPYYQPTPPGTLFMKLCLRAPG